MRIGKKMITVSDVDVTEVENQEEEAEMEKAGFFARHKKGLIIGAGAAALAAIGGLIAASKRGDDDYDEFDDFDDTDDTPDNEDSAEE